MKHWATTLAFATVASTTAFAQFPEVEPNDSKATATVVGGMTSGQFLDGNSISATTTGLDYWRVSTALATPAIYRHEMTITTTGTAGHASTLRGLNQTGGTVGVCPNTGTASNIGTTDTTIATGVTTPARMIAWYGFGKGEEMQYRVTGTASTTANYNATLNTAAVTPVVVPGTFNPGLIDIKTAGQTSTDTDIYLYDSNFNQVLDANGAASNDDEHCHGNTLQSWLTRNLTPGVYYAAIGAYNSCTDQKSPIDDDFLTGAVLDYPNALVSSISTISQDRDFQITDGVNTFTATPGSTLTTKAFELVFVQFTVGSPAVTYCTAKINSQGCSPAIGSTGTMSATATAGFVLTATNELNNKVGLVLYSEFGRDASPFGTGGILCVKAPTRRSKGFNSGGTPPPLADCTGVFAIDFNTFGRGLLGAPPNPAAYLSIPGQVVTAQFWGRDPGFPIPDNFSLSNGIEFTVGP